MKKFSLALMLFLAPFTASAQYGGSPYGGGPINLSLNLQTNGNWITNDGGDEGIYIDADGNVGIGTDSPTSVLTIEPDTDDIAFQIDDTNAKIAWQDGPYLSTSSLYTAAYDFSTSHWDGSGVVTTLFLEASTGFVGVGGTSPECGLHVGDGSSEIVSTTNDLYISGNVEVDGTLYSDTNLFVGGYLSAATIRAKSTDISLATVAGSSLVTIKADGKVGIGAASPVALLDVNGSIAKNITTPDLTGNSYTITATDYAVLIDDDDAQVTGTVVIALPAVATNTGRELVIKKIGNSYTVQLDGNGSETIDESLTKNLSTQYDSYTIICNGTEWWIE